MIGKIRTKLMSLYLTCSLEYYCQVFVVGLFVLSLVGFTSYYILFIYPAYINSDGATYYVLAQEILRSGQYFPMDWFYVNGDLMSFGKPGLIAFINSVGIGGYSSYATANFFLLLLSIFIVYYLLRTIGVSSFGSLLGSALITLPYSHHFMSHVHGIGSYLTRFIHMAVLMLLLLKVIRVNVRNRQFYIWLTTLFLFLLLASLENPSRFFVYFIVPNIIVFMLIGYINRTHEIQAFLKTWARPSSTFSSKAAIISVVVILSFSISVILYKYLETKLNIIHAASNATLAPLQDLPFRLAYTIYGILMLSGVDWQEGAKLSSFSGVISVLKLLVYPFAFLAPFFYIIRNWRNLTFFQQIFSLFSCSGFLFIGFIFSITTLQVNGLSEMAGSIRYIIPFFLFVLLCNVILWAYYAFYIKFALSISLALAVLTAWNSVIPVDAKSSMNSREGIIELLNEKDLHVGYAPYWHSHIFSILSDGRLEVRPIHLREKIESFYFLSSKRWYESNYSYSPVFFLVPENSARKMLEALMTSCFSPPDEQFSAFGYTVFIYMDNPMRTIFDGLLRNDSGNVCINTTSKHQVGSFDTRATALVSTPQDGPGFLHYGPYAKMNCGKYMARFTLESSGKKDGNYKKIGFIDISANGGKNVLAKKKIYNNSSTPVDINFDIDLNTQYQVEFRVFSYGISTISLLGIEIIQHSQGTDNCSFPITE